MLHFKALFSLCCFIYIASANNSKKEAEIYSDLFMEAMDQQDNNQQGESLDQSIEKQNNRLFPNEGQKLDRLWPSRWNGYFSVRETPGTNCRELTVEIRYKCTRFFGLSKSIFNHRCDVLIPRALKKHYERTISLNGRQYKVNVEAKRKSFWSSAAHFIIRSSGCSGGNFVLVPIVLGSCSEAGYSDKDFEYLAAHEMGHAILYAGRGPVWSLTHKGTSTWTQKVYSSSPILDCNKPEFDVMFYWRNSAGSRVWVPRYCDANKIKLADEDVKTMIEMGGGPSC